MCLFRLSSRYTQQPARGFSPATPSPKPSTLFGEDFYTVGLAFCSCARGYSFFLIDRGSQCFQQATWFGISRASRYGTINPIDMSKTESAKFNRQRQGRDQAPA